MCNGNTYTFTVTNGVDGEKGDKGDKGDSADNTVIFVIAILALLFSVANFALNLFKKNDKK